MRMLRLGKHVTYEHERIAYQFMFESNITYHRYEKKYNKFMKFQVCCIFSLEIRYIDFLLSFPVTLSSFNGPCTGMSVCKISLLHLTSGKPQVGYTSRSCWG